MMSSGGLRRMSLRWRGNIAAYRDGLIEARRLAHIVRASLLFERIPDPGDAYAELTVVLGAVEELLASALESPLLNPAPPGGEP